MPSTIAYDIDQILSLAVAEHPYSGLELFWKACDPNVTDNNERADITPVERNVFVLLNFGVYMGNGFGCRMDCNYPKGIKEFWIAAQSAECVGLEQTTQLFNEVDALLVKMGITRPLCEDLNIFNFSDLDDNVEAPDLVEKPQESDSYFGLYDVFERLSEPHKFDSRWWKLERSEVHPGLINYLLANKESLGFRKG